MSSSAPDDPVTGGDHCPLAWCHLASACGTISSAFPSSPSPRDRPLRPALVLALDVEERERAQRLRPVLRAQRAERLADFAALVRAMHARSACRADDRRARRRTRTPPRPPRPRPRCWARRTVRRAASPACRPRRRRSSSLASTICTKVDQPSEATPRKPERNAARALPSSLSGSPSAEHEGAGHRPFAGLGRALEHEGVGWIEPDGAQQFHAAVGPPRLGIEPARLRQRRQQRAALDLGLAHAPHQQIAVVVDVAAHALLRFEPRQIALARPRKIRIPARRRSAP